MDISKAICPECHEAMSPRVCECRKCRIRLEGEFTVSPLAQIPAEDQALIIAFVRSYGSIKKIQEVLGVSYPTARARIDRTIDNLNDMMSGPPDADQVIEQLARGDISIAEAMEQL
jgi:hypothetical protein